MPSALETMVKILKLERDQGAKNTAVVGGLGAFVESWQPQAREQARRAEQHILIDEIVDTLSKYEGLEDEDERSTKINHLLDRATNRAPAPPEYEARLSSWQEKVKTRRDSSRDRNRRPARRDHTDRRQVGNQRSGSKKRSYAYDSATYDEDFTAGPSNIRLDLPPLPGLTVPPRLPRPELTVEEQLALQRELDAPTTSVKGIGNTFAELLQQLDLHTIRDLLLSLPRGYRDYTNLAPIKDIQADEEATIIGTVVRSKVVSGSGGGKDLVVVISDGSDRLSIRFFRQDYLAARMSCGKQLVLSGKVTYFRDMKQMANPEWEELDRENLHTIGIVPVYRMTKGLRPRMFRRTMKSLTDEWAEKIPDPLPQAILERTDLADLGWAIKQAHFPDGWDHRNHAQSRLDFDKLLTLQLALLGGRREWQSVPGPMLAVDDSYLDTFVADVFPFEMTDAQKGAIAYVRRDVAKSIPMNRLIQGDVGSGKTAVAIVAVAMALSNGKQAAVMAPTSILARQHFQSFSEAFARMSADEKPVTALLTSALTASERESIYRGITDGSIDIVVGTHALIQQGVEFHDLAIAIIDEQQRFGVDQRAALRGKSQNPHLLVMSATPYPRTLALTKYADLDITLIKEKPPGRKEIVTKIIEPIARERLHGFVVAQLEQGRQAFFVYPLVEELETSESTSAMDSYEKLSQVFFRFRVCLLHGRMSAAEKDELMSDFADHKYDVMVTTSIAEVGVDVSNASIMAIDGANRFGLSQLHQLRGRVGRGEHQSYCFLIPDRSADVEVDRVRARQAGELGDYALTLAERRLSAMEESNDGFDLAEIDSQLRGYGDLLGRQQSGQNELQSMEQSYVKLAEIAQREARTLMEVDADLASPEHQLLAECVSRLSSDPGDIS